MYVSYFTVPSTTSNVVTAANTVFSTWGNGRLSTLATLILATIFGVIILAYVLKHIH